MMMMMMMMIMMMNCFYRVVKGVKPYCQIANIWTLDILRVGFWVLDASSTKLDTNAFGWSIGLATLKISSRFLALLFLYKLFELLF